MDSTNTRGRFRNVEIADIERLSKSIYWDQEQSVDAFILPIPVDKRIIKASKHLCTNIPADQLFQIGPFNVTNSPESHLSPFKNALDFLIIDGTPVLATRSGIIIEFQDQHHLWGTSPKFRDELNYLTIDHQNGIYSQYCHLAQNSVSTVFKSLGIDRDHIIGTKIEQRTQIAISGKTGWTDRDHLHFAIFKDDKNVDPTINPFGFKSIVPRFKL